MIIAAASVKARRRGPCRENRADARPSPKRLLALGRGMAKRAGVLARLPRPVALLLLALIGLASLWSLTTQPPPIKVAKKGGYTDVRLYHDIVAEMDKGQPYHQAAAAMQRLHHYPLKPFVTMRLPTLAEIVSLIGWSHLQWLAVALAFAAIFLWIVATENLLRWSERILVGLAVGWGSAMVSNQGLMALHEYWAGLFIAIALAGVVGWPRRWWAILLPAACGLFIRELTLPFLLLALAFSLYERQWKQVAAWSAVIAAFGIFMAIHAQEVAAAARPGDLPSPGWHAMQGFSAFLKAVIFTSVLAPLPLPLALLAAMLPLFGWLALPGRAGGFSCLLVAGYVVMISAFSRADTFYWGAVMLPWYFVGFALLPRAFWQLLAAIRGQRPA